VPRKRYQTGGGGRGERKEGGRGGRVGGGGGGYEDRGAAAGRTEGESGGAKTGEGELRKKEAWWVRGHLKWGGRPKVFCVGCGCQGRSEQRWVDEDTKIERRMQ